MPVLGAERDQRGGGFLARGAAARETHAEPGGSRAHLRHRAVEHRAQVHDVLHRAGSHERQRHRTARELLQRGRQVRHRLLLAPELLAHQRAFALGQPEPRLGGGEPGLGLLNARGERRGLARGTCRRVARCGRLALELDAACFRGAPRRLRLAQGGAGLRGVVRRGARWAPALTPSSRTSRTDDTAKKPFTRLILPDGTGGRQAGWSRGTTARAALPGRAGAARSRGRTPSAGRPHRARHGRARRRGR